MKWTDQSPPDTLATLSELPARANETALRTLSDAGKAQDCSVLIVEPVHQKVLAHLRSASVEQGGLLLGMAFGDENDQPSRLLITDAIAAVQSSGTGFSLRMEAAVWSDANARVAQMNDQKISDDDPARTRVIGWYHSHPGLGAFFSHTDKSTQAAFFNHRYSVGWVIDPSDDTHALFIGAQSKPVGAELIA